MKYFLILIFLTKAINAFGQSNVDFEQIIKSWTQGKLDHDGNVIQADVNRGGWYQLNINSDSSAIFGDPFNCGFGHERYGIWDLNKMDSIITFLFTKRKGYMNAPSSADINESEIYKIKKLTTDVLILEQTTGTNVKTLAFLKTQK